MKIIENIQLITFPANCWKKVYAFLWFNKITNFDQIQTFQIKHILVYSMYFFSAGTQ